MNKHTSLHELSSPLSRSPANSSYLMAMTALQNKIKQLQADLARTKTTKTTKPHSKDHTLHKLNIELSNQHKKVQELKLLSQQLAKTNQDCSSLQATSAKVLSKLHETVHDLRCQLEILQHSRMNNQNDYKHRIEAILREYEDLKVVQQRM